MKRSRCPTCSTRRCCRAARDQLARACAVVSVIGFSTSTCAPASRNAQRDLAVRRRRGDDADGIDLAEQLAIVAVGQRARARPPRARRSPPRLSTTPTSCSRAAAHISARGSAQIADPDHGRSDFFHAAAIMPKACSMPGGSTRANRLAAAAHGTHYRGARGASAARTADCWHSCLAYRACCVMPCLIFVVGRLVLGPYAARQRVRALARFPGWAGLTARRPSGSSLLGPYLLVWLLRGGPPAVT